MLLRSFWILDRLGHVCCASHKPGRKMIFILMFFVMFFRAGNIPHRKLSRLQIARPYLSPPSWPFYLETRPVQQNTLGGGFKYVFVHSYLGKIPMLRVAYFFQMGWLKPSTRYRSWAKQTMNSFWRAFEDVSGGRWFSNLAGTLSRMYKKSLHKIAHDCKPGDSIRDLFGMVK